jgi:hypothetical protein
VRRDDDDMVWLIFVYQQCVAALELSNTGSLFGFPVCACKILLTLQQVKLDGAQKTQRHQYTAAAMVPRLDKYHEEAVRSTCLPNFGK